MTRKRNQPARWNEITVERNGKTYRARYHVERGVVTVEAMSADTTVDQIHKRIYQTLAP